MSSLVDPRELTAAELAALRNISAYRLYRRPGGFSCAGGPRVTINMVRRLAQRGLVERNGNEKWKPALQLTYHGRNTLAVDEQRRQP